MTKDGVVKKNPAKRYNMYRIIGGRYPIDSTEGSMTKRHTYMIKATSQEEAINEVKKQYPYGFFVDSVFITKRGV